MLPILRLSLLSCILTSFVFAGGDIIAFSDQCLTSQTLLSGEVFCKSSDNAEATSVEYIYTSTVTARKTANAQASEAASSPWDFDAICTQELEHINAPLCIYTSTKFASGRGISVFTQPSKAEKLLQVLAFKQPSLLLQTSINSHSDRPWTVQSLPGRGKGMLAKRAISPGEIITSYTPVFVAARDVGNLITGLDLEYLFRLAVNQLPVPSRDALSSLARSFDMPDYAIQDIVATNAFEFDIDGSMHLAIYPETARLNHDCAPNAQYFINASMLTHTVRTARPVAEGEELTIAYSLPLTPYKTRHENLNQTFHFECGCKRCKNPRDSDAALKRISALEARIMGFVSGEGFDDEGMKWARELIGLYEQEGLQSLMMRPYGLAAQVSAALKDEEDAKRWAGRAVEFGVLMQGDEGADVREMKELADAPRRHRSWWGRGM